MKPRRSVNMIVPTTSTAPRRSRGRCEQHLVHDLLRDEAREDVACARALECGHGIVRADRADGREDERRHRVGERDHQPLLEAELRRDRESDADGQREQDRRHEREAQAGDRREEAEERDQQGDERDGRRLQGIVVEHGPDRIRLELRPGHVLVASRRGGVDVVQRGADDPTTAILPRNVEAGRRPCNTSAKDTVWIVPGGPRKSIHGNPSPGGAVSCRPPATSTVATRATRACRRRTGPGGSHRLDREEPQRLPPAC